MSQQLVKKKLTGGYENVMPKSWIEAIKDKNTGQTLVEILQGFNMYFLPYNGNTPSTRCLVPTILRKKGLWITYVKYDGNVYTEWYAASDIDDESWENSSNWRIGNNTLVGDITISANGNWVINGTETEFKAVGEKGNTPLIRIVNNRLQVSYDLGDTYIDVTDNPVYTKFRWLATSGDTQANNVGRIQVSTDEGKTWTNMSNDFINNLHISRYIGADESLPTSGVAEGTIYAKGPTYAVEDTSNSNPIYRLWVYAWKDNTLAWQDNGEFTSIAAGIVQETGSNENAVMSQKATAAAITELELKTIKSVGDSSYVVNSFQNFEQGTLDSVGENVESIYRWRSKEYILLPIINNQPEKLHVLKSDDINIYMYWYDENNTFISYSDYITNSDFIITPPISARKCKITITPVPDKIFPKEVLASALLVIRASKADTMVLAEKINTATTHDLLSNGWSIGSYYDTISPINNRRYKVIPVSFGDKFICKVNSESWYIYIYFADTEGTINYIMVKSNISIVINQIDGRIPTEMRITAVPHPDVLNITEEKWKTFDVSMKKEQLPQLCKLAVAEWNFGLLNNGVVPLRIEDDKVDEYLPKIKKLITALGADVLYATEYTKELDRSQTRNTYNEVLKQFYPYYYYGGNYMAIFSKYPFSVQSVTSPDGRNCEFGIININGNTIGFGEIHPRSTEGTEAEDARIADHQAVVDYFAKYEKVIVGGDFNTYEDRELDVYRNAGWNLGNCGYFGNIDTYRPSDRPWYIDNIITKGINIDNFVKIDNRADVSDHYPVVANLSFL